MKSEILERLAEQRAIIEGALATEKGARAKYALATATGDTQSLIGLEQAEAEIKRLELQLERNTLATRHAEAKASSAGRERLKGDAKADALSAIHASAAVVDISRKIDTKIGEFGQLLARLGQLNKQIRDNLRAAVNNVELSDRQREVLLEQAGDIGIGRRFGAALASALSGFGSGGSGIYNDDIASLPAPRPGFSFEDAAEVAFDDVAAKVSRLVGPSFVDVTAKAARLSESA
jgi:hypothetical protein